MSICLSDGCESKIYDLVNRFNAASRTNKLTGYQQKWYPLTRRANLRTDNPNDIQLIARMFIKTP